MKKFIMDFDCFSFVDDTCYRIFYLFCVYSR